MLLVLVSVLSVLLVLTPTQASTSVMTVIRVLSVVLTPPTVLAVHQACTPDRPARLSA